MAESSLNFATIMSEYEQTIECPSQGSDLMDTSVGSRNSDDTLVFSNAESGEIKLFCEAPVLGPSYIASFYPYTKIIANLCGPLGSYQTFESWLHNVTEQLSLLHPLLKSLPQSARNLVALVAAQSLAQSGTDPLQAYRLFRYPIQMEDLLSKIELASTTKTKQSWEDIQLLQTLAISPDWNCPMILLMQAVDDATETLVGKVESVDETVLYALSRNTNSKWIADAAKQCLKKAGPTIDDFYKDVAKKVQIYND